MELMNSLRSLYAPYIGSRINFSSRDDLEPANWCFFSFQNIHLSIKLLFIIFFFELINFEAFLIQEIINLRILSNDNNKGVFRIERSGKLVSKV